MSTLYQLINPLSDEQRIAARAHARAIVVKDAGDMPDRSTFINHTQSKYPAWMTRLIIGLCVAVLTAAFAPSSLRLFYIGSHTFVETLPDAHAAMIAGASIVLMAEAAQVLFSLAAAVMDTSKTAKRLLYIGMAGATVLALVGNGQLALPGHWGNPFAWFEALMPPLVVLGTAYILKEQMLASIHQRHAAETTYQAELVAWKTATSSPERHPRYMSALANALKTLLIEENSKGTGAMRRIEMMKLLERPHWIHLVRREIEAEQWFASEEAIELPALPELPEQVKAPRKTNKAEQPTAEAVVIQEPRPFGATAHDVGELENTPMIALASVTGGIVTSSDNGTH